MALQKAIEMNAAPVDDPEREFKMGGAKLEFFIDDEDVHPKHARTILTVQREDADSLAVELTFAESIVVGQMLQQLGHKVALMIRGLLGPGGEETGSDQLPDSESVIQKTGG